MRLRSSPPDWTSASPFRKRTGKTQGIRLRMRPPKKASSTMRGRPGVAGDGGAEFGELAELAGLAISVEFSPARTVTGGPGAAVNSYARPFDNSRIPLN